MKSERLEHKARVILTIICSIFLFAGNVSAKKMALTLDDCREMAAAKNKQSRINKENAAAATDLRRAAVASFFPKVSANGGYTWVEKNLYLIPDNYNFAIGTMNADGTFAFNDDAIKTRLFDYGDLKARFPELDKRLSDWVAEEYTKAREASELDIHNVFVAQVGVTQPIFLGGKLVELYKIAKATEQMEMLKAGKADEDLMLKVDEAYWRVISVEQKFLLADKYCTMLRKAEQDISAAMEEGTMTKADLLKIRVALNEAEMNRQKAEDGLALSKMALCQLVGLELDTEVQLDDSNLDSPSLAKAEDIDMDRVLQQRRELQMLEQAEKIAKAGVMMTASTLMPNIVASANYITTNPNLQNGFQNKFGGTFTAGVAVNIPIAHADDIYRLKAAKHKAKTVELQLEEAKEKIELQVTQTSQQLTTANHKLQAATANIENAEENLRLAQAAFEEGMLTSTELLGAQTAWLKAYSEKIDAAIDLRMAEVYLKNHTGE